MPFDGSGNFNRVMNWVNDAAAAIKIRADRHDQEDDNFASGLSNTLTKDGQSQPTANIGLNGKRLVNVANPVDPQDAATKNSSEAIRTYNTGVRLTGASTGVAPNFVSTAFLGFTEADMAVVGRRADATATPPTQNRLVFNDKVDGTGTDLFTVNEDGSVSGAVNMTLSVKIASGTYTKPANLKYLEVWVVGGGGASSTASATAAGQASAGGGGAGGGVSYKLYKAADLAASVAYTIGAAGNTPGGAGAAGGNSTFAGQTSGGGGGAGAVLAAGNTASFTAGFGVGGTASGGDLDLAGDSGGPGVRMPHGIAAGQSGSGGGNLFAPYLTGQAGSGVFPSATGGFPGGGARGAANGPSQVATAGATGGAGAIILKEHF